MEKELKALLIFDQTISQNKLRRKINFLSPEHLSLFPITSDYSLIRDTENTCRFELKGNAEVKLIESSRLIDEQVDILREKISKWSADLGNYKIGKKSLKEWFLLPRGEVSSWWFSLLSEKNTLKTNVFFRLAQLQAFDRTVSLSKFDLCICSVSEKSFSSAIGMVCKRHSVRFLLTSAVSARGKPFKEYVKSYLSQEEAFCIILKACVNLGIRVLRAMRARLTLGPIEKRMKTFDNSILFISYFPAIDKEAAEKGILKNKYAIPLQEKLFQAEKRIVWIWMYVFLDDHSYGDALRLAEKFSKNGEANFFLDEFLTLKVLLKVIRLWFRQIWIFLRLKRLIPEHAICNNLSIPEAAVSVKNLMLDSFVGCTGLEGFYYFQLYKEVFRYFSYVSHCIYYTEMLAWEKALCAAKKHMASGIKTVAFMHTTISVNFFPYFHHPSEIDSVPLPDVLACNGDIPMGFMKNCGYPNVTKVEAVRHLYLNDYLDNPEFSKRENTVLIAGSINKTETKALVSLIYEAFPKPEIFKVWLRGHPSLPFKKIFEELYIDIRRCGYVIKDDPIDKLLHSARILIVGNSTVAVEALAAGCKVIIPVFSDSMFMSPLKGFEKYYLKVSDPAELKAAIEKFMEYGEEEDLGDAKDFVSRYWCLDRSLKRWENLLK